MVDKFLSLQRYIIFIYEETLNIDLSSCHIRTIGRQFVTNQWVCEGVTKLGGKHLIWQLCQIVDIYNPNTSDT